MSCTTVHIHEVHIQVLWFLVVATFLLAAATLVLWRKVGKISSLLAERKKPDVAPAVSPPPSPVSAASIFPPRPPPVRTNLRGEEDSVPSPPRPSPSPKPKPSMAVGSRSPLTSSRLVPERLPPGATPELFALDDGQTVEQPVGSLPLRADRDGGIRVVARYAEDNPAKKKA